MGVFGQHLSPKNTKKHILRYKITKKLLIQPYKMVYNTPHWDLWWRLQKTGNIHFGTHLVCPIWDFCICPFSMFIACVRIWIFYGGGRLFFYFFMSHWGCLLAEECLLYTFWENYGLKTTYRKHHGWRYLLSYFTAIPFLPRSDQVTHKQWHKSEQRCFFKCPSGCFHGLKCL